MELTLELTPKQTKFVAEVVSGATLTAAYKAAYEADDMAPGRSGWRRAAWHVTLTLP